MIYGEYYCVECRMLFNNGINRYTVEYCFGTRTWYIFKDEERTNALAKFPITKKVPVNTRVDIAREYLYKYLDTLEKQPSLKK